MDQQGTCIILDKKYNIENNSEQNIIIESNMGWQDISK
jgi:hypothetical protein